MASSSNEADFQDDDLEDQDFNLNRDSDEGFCLDLPAILQNARNFYKY